MISTNGVVIKNAFNKEFLTTCKPKSQHINEIKLSGKGNTANNNKMERINGEIRDRKSYERLKNKRDFNSSRDADLS